jgi:C-terminal, D2-small domain, of ClpB protein
LSRAFYGQAYFRPELLNRLDEVVIFRQLGPKEVRTVADLVLAETAKRIAAKGISLEVTASLMQRICEKGYDKACTKAPLFCYAFSVLYTFLVPWEAGLYLDYGHTVT